MQQRPISIQSFNPKRNDKIVMDTNIILKIFSPFVQEGKAGIYTDLLFKIKKSGAKLLISSIQVSEFINRCIRIQYELYKKNNKEECDYKTDYRNTEDYKKNMDAILDIVKNDILSYFDVVDDRFTEMRKDNIYIYTFSYDFNDALIAELSNLYDAILITDDGDYINYHIKSQLVTSNRLLLMKR